MAFTATTTWEVAAIGSDGNAGANTNAGGFDPGNASMVTDLTTDANTANTSSPVVSSASYNFAARDVGHWLFIKAGTNWLPGWYKIASVASNKATLSAAIGAGVLWSTGGAYSVSIAAGVASVGTPTGGTWSIDYSQCGTGLAFSDLVQATTTTCTSAAMPMGKNFVGNTFRIASGTGTWTVQTLLITSVTGTTATVDKTLGGTGGTGGTGVLGGCLATPGMAGSLHISQNKIWIKNGTYTITSATTNVAAGCLSLTAGSATAGMTAAYGYASLRTDAPKTTSRPTLQASGITSFNVTSLNANTEVAYLILDGASLATSCGVNGVNISSRSRYVTAKNCKNAGFTNAHYLYCDATGCATISAFLAGFGYGCVAWSNTVTGFEANLSIHFVDCLSVNNSGASSDGFSAGSGTGARFINCTAYNNGRHGFHNPSSTWGVFTNCVSYANTGANFAVAATNDNVVLENCAAGLGGVSSANFSASINSRCQIGNITLSADPFTAKSSGDYSLNSTAGGGAACRAAGVIGAFPGIATTTYPDIGAAQTQGGGSSGGLIVHPGMLGV